MRLPYYGPFRLLPWEELLWHRHRADLWTNLPMSILRHSSVVRNLLPHFLDLLYNREESYGEINIARPMKDPPGQSQIHVLIKTPGKAWNPPRHGDTELDHLWRHSGLILLQSKANRTSDLPAIPDDNWNGHVSSPKNEWVGKARWETYWTLFLTKRARFEKCGKWLYCTDAPSTYHYSMYPPPPKLVCFADFPPPFFPTPNKKSSPFSSSAFSYAQEMGLIQPCGEGGEGEKMN